MGVKNSLKGFGKNKPKKQKEELVKSILTLSEDQTTFLSRDLSKTPEDELWGEYGQLLGTSAITFFEAGRRLVELQSRYSKKGSGSFQAKCKEKGIPKTQAQTIIDKYHVLENQKGKGRTMEQLLYDAEKLEGASQRTTRELKNAPEEVKVKFFEGEISSQEEIKNETRKILKVEEPIEAEIVEDGLSRNVPGGSTGTLETIEASNSCTATELKCEENGCSATEREYKDYEVETLVNKKKYFDKLIKDREKDIRDFKKEINVINLELETRNNRKFEGM